MNRIFVIGLTLALFAAGCSSSTSGANNTATTTDTGAIDSGGAVSGEGDVKASDSSADAQSSGDAAKTDTSKVDVKKDVATGPAKCSPDDDACLNTCASDACATQFDACQKDAKCADLIPCLNKCQNVPLPTDPTGTNCAKTCLDTAGDSVTKLYEAQTCMANKCFVCDAGDQNCEAACASTLCLDSLLGCQADNACAGLLGCIGKCKDQTCAQACAGKFPDAQQQFGEFIQCYQSNATNCE